MATLGPTSLKLPRLHVRDELVKARPELAELLGEQESRMGSNAPGFAGKVKKAQMNMTSTAGRSLLAGSLLEEEVSQEELLQREMEAVKRERAHLLEQLMLVKTDPGKAGGELQREDIQHLRQEVALKKATLNKLHEEVLAKNKEVQRLILTSQDCTLLMPDGSPKAQARLAELKTEHEALDVELAEAEAKHRLYTLLEARTKRELMAMATEVAEAQRLQTAYEEDEATLLLYVHAMKAALEDAIKEKNDTSRYYEDTRDDWTRKLRDRHKEVRELQNRQQDDAAREDRRLKAIQEKEAAEREKRAQLKMQEEVYALQLQAIQPKLEALEEAWAKLHTMTGADSPDTLIAYWKGLKIQEESMHELARMAEARQAEARQHVQTLLAERSQLLEDASKDDGSSSRPQGVEGANDRLSDDNKAMESIEEAAGRAATAKKQFDRLRDVCISAQQGIYAMIARLETALAKMDLYKPTAADYRSSPEANTAVRPRRTMSNSKAQDWSTDRKTTDIPVGPKLQRLYTIDQEEFFPDLPGLVQTLVEKVQAVMVLAGKVGEGGRTPKTIAQENSPPRKALRGNSMRRRTWTGPAWMAASPSPALAPIDEAGSAPQKQAERRVDLSRLVGYTEEPAAAQAAHDDDEANGEEWDGIASRHIIKNRALKIVQRHRAANLPKPAKK